MLSNVVYHIKCKNCSDSKIGMSTRICAIRIEEHMKVKISHFYQRERQTSTLKKDIKWILIISKFWTEQVMS